MAAPTRAAAALTFKRRNWYYVPAGGFADPTAPTALELSAASVVDFTRMAFRDGTTAPTQATNRVTQSERLGDDLNYEMKGVTQLTGGTLQCAVDPQAVAGGDGKLAWEAFVDGPDGGFLVRRLNVPRDTAPTIGQFVTVYPSDIAPAFEVEVGQGEGAEVGCTADYFIRDAITQMVALA